MEEFLQAQEALKRPGVAGWWVRVLEDVDQERRDALLAAAENREISHRAIAVVLERWGYRVSREQVAHWRRSHCRSEVAGER